MNKHVERAKQLRDTAPQSNNCAQTIMRAYAEEMGLTEEQAAAIGCNFGGGMKCGGTCGAITGALMVLGTKGVISPAAVGEFRRRMAQKQPGVLLLFPRGRLQLPGNCLQLLLSACKLRLHVLPGKRLHRFVQPIIA